MEFIRPFAFAWCMTGIFTKVDFAIAIETRAVIIETTFMAVIIKMTFTTFMPFFAFMAIVVEMAFTAVWPFFAFATVIVVETAFRLFFAFGGGWRIFTHIGGVFRV